MPIRNRKRLRRKILAIPKAIKDAIRPVLERGADELVAMQKTLVPVLDEPTKKREGGELRDSIRWVYGAPPQGTLGSIGGNKRKPPEGINDLRISVFAGGEEAYWARWVEFGTVKMAPRPFFFPPYRFMNKRIRRQATSAAKKAIKKLAKSTQDGG